jgi:15-cis-phytoene synthase
MSEGSAVTPRAIAVAESRAILATHARSFRWAAAFLPADRRDDAAVLYAFCRAADDAVDEAPNRDQAAAALGELAHGIDAGGPPVASALREVSLRRGIALDAARQLVEGLSGDLEPVCIADDEALLRYCYHAAGTVGVLMSPLLGVGDPHALPHAVDLGIAMQLTNICRDVAEDAARGRVYLPRRRLERAGTSPEAILAGRAEPDRVAAVVLDLLDLADDYYRSADAGMRFISARARLAIVVASRIYRAIGWRLRRAGGDALAGRTVVPGYEKLLWVFVAIAIWLSMGLSRRHQAHRAELHRALAGLVRPPISTGAS